MQYFYLYHQILTNQSKKKCSLCTVIPPGKVLAVELVSFPVEFGKLRTRCACAAQNYNKVTFRANEQDSRQERDIYKQDTEDSHQQLDIYKQGSKQQMDYLPKL